MNYSRAPWKAIKNSSWSETHKANFSNTEGYVICFNNHNQELVTIASVHTPFAEPKDKTDGNAKLIAAAPEMYGLLKEVLYQQAGDESMGIDTFHAKVNELLNKIVLMLPIWIHNDLLIKNNERIQFYLQY